MKRIHNHRYGGSEGSRLEAVERLPPGSGEVLLHVSAYPDRAGSCAAEARPFLGLRLSRKLAMLGLIAAARARRPSTTVGRNVALVEAFSALIKLEADHQPNGRLIIAPAAGLS